MKNHVKLTYKTAQNRRKHHVMLIQILLSCLLCLSLASADTVKLTPLDESEFSRYSYYIQQGDVVIALPIKCHAEMVANQSNCGALRFNSPEDTAGVYAFFSIQCPLDGDPSTASLTESQIQTVLETISAVPEALTYKQEKDEATGETYLRVFETRDGVYTEHLLALHNGWLLNSMVQKVDGSQGLTAGEITLQQDTLGSVHELEQSMPRLQKFTFPNSEITLDLPASLYLTVQLDERAENFVFISHKQPGVVLSTVMLRSVYNRDLLNKTVATIDEPMYDTLMLQIGISGEQSLKDAKIISGFAGDTPVLIYGDSYTTRNMLAIRDGWAICTAMLESESIDSTWSQAVQDAVMRQLLGSHEAVPDYLPATPIQREGNTLLFPLMTRCLTVQIPDGYTVDIDEDLATQRTVYLTNESDSNQYIQLSSLYSSAITGDEPLTELYPDEALAEQCAAIKDQFASNGVDVTNATSAVAEKGLFQTPTLCFADGNGNIASYLWMMDSYGVSATYNSHGKSLTPKEHALLFDLLSDTVMQNVR